MSGIIYPVHVGWTPHPVVGIGDTTNTPKINRRNNVSSLLPRYEPWRLHHGLLLAGFHRRDGTGPSAWPSDDRVASVCYGQLQESMSRYGRQSMQKRAVSWMITRLSPLVNGDWFQTCVRVSQSLNYARASQTV